MFYIKYGIEGVAGEFKAGPYAAGEVQYHCNDIREYDGVLYTIVVSAEDEDEVEDDLTKAFE